MNFINVFRRFADWLIVAIPKLISKNKELREEIRSVIGELVDELAGGLELVAHRLKAARRISDTSALTSYLSESRQKLYQSFSEFRVCEDIRNLEDRFNQIFDPTRTAVELGHASEVRTLISNLENHERLIFDMIDSTFTAIDSAVTSPATAQDRNLLDKLIHDAIADCDRKRDEIKAIARQIIDSM
jgi:hypothetical protein